MQDQARAAIAPQYQESDEGESQGGVVIPMFRGVQQATRPLVTLANGAWKKPDVCRRFKVSERTVERWMKEQGLPSEKPFGPKGPVRFDPRKVEAWWIAKCRNGSFTVGAGIVLKILFG